MVDLTVLVFKLRLVIQSNVVGGVLCVRVHSEGAQLWSRLLANNAIYTYIHTCTLLTVQDLYALWLDYRCCRCYSVVGYAWWLEHRVYMIINMPCYLYVIDWMANSFWPSNAKCKVCRIWVFVGQNGPITCGIDVFRFMVEFLTCKINYLQLFLPRILSSLILNLTNIGCSSLF